MKSPRKWQKCNLVVMDRLCGQRHGLAMNWVDRLCTSADEQLLSGRRAVVIVWWAAAGVGCSSLTLRFSWTVTLVILGLGFLRARVLRLCWTAAFPPIFLKLRKGPLWSCAELLQSYALCSSDQCRTVKLRLPTVRELFWGMLGRGDGGWRGIGVSGSGYNEVLAMQVLNLIWLRRTKKTCKASCVCNGSLRVRCSAVVPGVLACIRMYILYVCVYICVCVYVCRHVNMYIYACVCVFVHLCVYTHVYVYAYAYLCIDCGSQYHCFSVWTVSCMCMCVRVHMYAYAYVCRYINMCILFAVSVACTLQVFWALVHRQVCTLHRCVFTPTYTSANTLAAGCAHMCVCMYVCICVHMHVDAYVHLRYCLTRWGVVAKIFYLCIRVHMHANVYVCACMRA